MSLQGEHQHPLQEMFPVQDKCWYISVQIEGGIELGTCCAGSGVPVGASVSHSDIKEVRIGLGMCHDK